MTNSRVLVADDEAMIRAGVRHILSSFPDIEVVGEASDADEAVDQTRALQPDVVLVDLHMGSETAGVDATRGIVELDPDATSVPAVLILTNFWADELVCDALRAGASGYVLKHVVSDHLASAIRAVAAGNAWLDPVVAKTLLDQFSRRDVPARRSPAELRRLTGREREVLILLARGLATTEIVEHLVIGEATVKTHIHRILLKLGLRDRAQAVAAAYQSGLVTVP